MNPIQQARRHLEALSAKHSHAHVFYHSDADGLMSAWMLTEVLSSLGVRRVTSRCVWNHEFDFAFLSRVAPLMRGSFAIFTDLPVAQAYEDLRSFCETTPSYIYDHHRPPTAKMKIENELMYQNSILFTKNAASWPAAFFARLLHEDVFGETDHGTLLCGVGLVGDHALESFETVHTRLLAKFPGIADGASIWDSCIGRLCSGFNVLFKAQPSGIEQDLCCSMPRDWADPLSSIRQFLAQQKTAELSELIRIEVEEWTSKLRSSTRDRSPGRPIVCTTDMKTFSVGIVAAKLIASNVTDFVCLGFRLADRIQYELRSSQTAPCNVLALLDLVKEEIQPISCGGHPNAGGLLVATRDSRRVELAVMQHYKEAQRRTPNAKC